jgi:hypothetical protein
VRSEIAPLLAASPRSGGVYDVAYALSIVVAYLVPALPRLPDRDAEGLHDFPVVRACFAV